MCGSVYVCVTGEEGVLWVVLCIYIHMLLVLCVVTSYP